MGKLIPISLLFLFTATFNVHATGNVKEINIAASEVFIPEIIERTAEAKIVLSGLFPNSCYRWSRAEVTSPTAMTHEVRAMALVTVDTMCLMVLVPYSKEINLGLMSPGDHMIKFISGDGTYFERRLVVR